MNRLRTSVLGVAALLALLGIALGFQRWLGGGKTPPELCAALTQQRITHVYAAGDAALRCDRIEVRPPSPALARALEGNDPAALAKQLLGDKGGALAIGTDGAGKGLQRTLTGLGSVAGLRGVAIGPQVSVYVAAPAQTLSLRERDALAYVARALLRGAREPNVNSFPPALRKVERVEVMVLLREHGEPRLWRSARGTSIARALMTAARVARDRWRERETAMGGPLARRLLDLDVEVTLLHEDGTLLATQRTFVDRAVDGSHGIGFEYLSGWHYVLPSDMARRGKGSAYAALTSLMAEQALSPAVLVQTALRAYRFVAETVGVSRAPLSGDASPG